MGSGAGSLSVATNIDTETGFILDAAEFGGTIDIASVSASGASTVSVGGGDHSAGQTIMGGNFTLDASTSTTGAVPRTTVSAGGNASITMGAGSGATAVGSAQGGGSYSIDASSSSGTATVTDCFSIWRRYY